MFMSLLINTSLPKKCLSLNFCKLENAFVHLLYEQIEQNKDLMKLIKRTYTFSIVAFYYC
jgi:hypothetical protein